MTAYTDYLAAPVRYDSGEFLYTPVDLLQPRLVPEMVQADPELAKVNGEMQAVLEEQFGPPRDGLPYERYIERQHRPDAADLDFCRRHGFFRMPISKELGGEGRPKIDYYLLTINAKKLADVGISLLIQVNSSLGTTPVLLAQKKDLPQAQQQVAAFVADGALHAEITRELEGLVKSGGQHRRQPASGENGLAERASGSDDLEPRAASGACPSLHPSVAGDGSSRPPVRDGQSGSRPESSRFGMARRSQPGRRVPRGNPATGTGVRAFLALGGQRPDFGIRTDGTVRWVGYGSCRHARAPALGPRRRAGEGVYRFVPKDAREPRVLLDAAGWSFAQAVACYRWSDSVESAPIRFDEYDYETDDPGKMRYFECGGAISLYGHRRATGARRPALVRLLGTDRREDVDHQWPHVRHHVPVCQDGEGRHRLHRRPARRGAHRREGRGQDGAARLADERAVAARRCACRART